MNVPIQQTHSTVRRRCPSLQTLLMRSMLIVVVICVFVAPGSSGARSAEPEIIARVNGEDVTRSELQRVQADLLTLRRLQEGAGDKSPDGKELERLALQKLIQRRLILQEAERRNLSVTDDEFDQALTALRGRFKDLKSFGIWMRESGLDDWSLFEAIRADMLANRLLAALMKEVHLTEEEVRDFYEAHKEDLTIGEEVRLRIIVVASRAAAEEILAALRQGENFSRLARRRSLGMRAARGGDTGWVDFQTLPPLLQRTVGRLKAGDASRPLQKNADEFLIVGLQGRRSVRARSLAHAQPEIERRLLPAKQQETVQSWLAEQEKKSKIQVFIQPQ